MKPTFRSSQIGYYAQRNIARNSPNMPGKKEKAAKASSSGKIKPKDGASKKGAHAAAAAAGQKVKGSKAAPAAAGATVTSDDRFKHMHYDPRFRVCSCSMFGRRPHARFMPTRPFMSHLLLASEALGLAGRACAAGRMQ